MEAISRISHSPEVPLDKLDISKKELLALDNNPPQETIQDEDNVQVQDVNDVGKHEIAKESISSYEDKIKNILADNNVFLEFRKDEETGKMIMKIINEQTKEVVSQTPSDLSLKISRLINGYINSEEK